MNLNSEISRAIRKIIPHDSSFLHALQFFFAIFTMLKIKIFRKPFLTCERADLHSDFFYVSGWALSPDGIKKIDIELDDSFCGIAEIKRKRPDVAKIFRYFPGAADSGFYFNAPVNREAINNIEYHNAVITAYNHYGYKYKLKIKRMPNAYLSWIAKNEPGKKQLNTLKRAAFPTLPRFVVIIYGDTGNQEKLNRSIGSIQAQINIKPDYLIVKADESALPFNYDYTGFLRSGDTLAAFTSVELCGFINSQPDADFIYFDEDRCEFESKRRSLPHFKPDWSPDTLLSTNYIGECFFISRNIYDKIPANVLFPAEWDERALYRMVLFATSAAVKILHIPKILYHRDISQRIILDEAGMKKDIADFLRLTGNDFVAVEKGLIDCTFCIRYKTTPNPRISIIIPNRDNATLLENCVNSIFRLSTYKNIELLVVENDSKNSDTFKLYDRLAEKHCVEIINWNKEFNYSEINNYAAARSGGEILLFLNNDTEVISPDWLERMLEYALLPRTGAVGAKLYYSDGKIQHAGVIIKVGNFAAGHSHHYSDGKSDGYFGRLKIVQNLSAVTGACLMLRRKVFEEAGGFCPEFAVALNDVDLCLKIRSLGYSVIWTPYAELYHFEYKTRGINSLPEQDSRWLEEVKLFQSRWQGIFNAGDPFYNPNLTLMHEDFSLKTE